MKVIAICNLPDGITLDHAWFVAEDGLYAQKVAIRPLPKRNEYRADTKHENMDKYSTGYADGYNDCLSEISGETE